MSDKAPHLFQTASHWGVYDVAVNGDTVSVAGAYAGDRSPSPLIHSLPAIVRGAERVRRPSVRRGYFKSGPGKTSPDRGGDSFVEVSWDTALKLVADELQRVRAQHGDDAIYGGSYGWASAGKLHHAPSQVKRFLNLGGGFTDKLGNHSFGSAMVILPYVIGRGDVTNMASDWSSVVGNTQLFLLFGGANPKNSQLCSGGLTVHSSQDWMLRAAKSGTRFVNIGPARGDTADGLDAEWLSIRPNTDTALMLGLAHTLAAEGLADERFLAAYTTGYERFKPYLLGTTDGTPKDATWAARICDIPSDAITALARRMTSSRTMISLGWAAQRGDHGEQPCWMLATLAAMLGQIGLPGGGFAFGYGAVNGVGMPRPDRLPKPRLGVGVNPVKSHVPVGRVTDMLLSPGETIDYNGGRYTYPDIRMIYTCGGNPFHHNAQLNKLVACWQRPETVIVHEPFWTPAAKHADIVLPATTTLERNDILAADLDRHYVAMKQAIAPVFEARNDLDTFAELADRMGYRDAFTEGRNEMGWLRHLYTEAAGSCVKLGHAMPSFDEFWDKGVHAFPEPASGAVFLAEFRADPAKNPLKTLSGKLEIWSEKIAGFGYADCPAHPVWLEPAEWLGSELTQRFPIHLISNQPRTRLHSQLDPAPVSRQSKIHDREPLRLHPDDAAKRGIADGSTVRVFNDRGAFVAGVMLDAQLRPGVAQISTGAWFDPETPGTPGSMDKHGNPNVLTSDRGTSSLAQSNSVQSLLVEIEKINDAPAVSAFVPPQFNAAH